MVLSVVPAGDSSRGDFEVYDKQNASLGSRLHHQTLNLDPQYMVMQVGVELGKKGEVKVDGFNQSSVASIYAVGDVTDRVNLTPVALMEGMAFAKNVFG